MVQDVDGNCIAVTADLWTIPIRKTKKLDKRQSRDFPIGAELGCFHQKNRIENNSIFKNNNVFDSKLSSVNMIRAYEVTNET